MYKKKIFGPNSFVIPAKMETAPTFLEVQALQWENDSNYNFLKKTLSNMILQKKPYCWQYINHKPK